MHFVMIDFDKGVVDGRLGCADGTINDYSSDAFGFQFASDLSGQPSQFASSFVAFDSVSDFGWKGVYELDPLVGVVFFGLSKGLFG